MKSYVAITAAGAIIGAAVNGMPVLDNQAAVNGLGAQIPAQAGIAGFKHDIRKGLGFNASKPIMSISSEALVVHQTTTMADYKQPMATEVNKCTTFPISEPALGLTGIMEMCAPMKTTLNMDIGTKTTLEQVNAPIVTAPHITSALSIEIATAAPVEQSTTMEIHERVSSWCVTATRIDGSKPYICTAGVDNYPRPPGTATFIYTPFSGPTPTTPSFFLTTFSEDPAMPSIAPDYTPFATPTTSEPSFFLTTFSEDPEMVAAASTSTPLTTSSTEYSIIGAPIVTRATTVEPVITETQTVFVTASA
ncbi:uncharacterized protein CCOS01_14958 [Colletotrichum costaricense]|uniref:Uncharacterized protein n=1 Tax=Colletotrichum costaricense TaxID=1209916 RepID=A0AAJ0DTQ9_9PEZI|nr:uncharacterized protein CCOS01_14958 [Colletotrichum costaricense]KAK1511196.1 hypothetical protein CCOS01_14958 [Colletotrichum costaricense]